MPAVEADPPEAVRGVPLVQLAAVHAAVAEGFALDEALDVEGLPRAVWSEAEVSWKARLVSTASEMSRYAEELSRQQDRLARRVAPLEKELESWIHFLRCYEAHPDPFDLLTAVGLGLNDMSRLGRHWNRRFDLDPKLAKDAAKLSLKIEGRIQKGEKPRLPMIEVSEARLLPSPAANTYVAPAAAGAQATQLPESAPVLGLDQYAALCADLRVADARDHEAVLARYQIDARHAVAIDEAWRARLESDRELLSDFRVLVGHYEQTAAMRRRSAAERPAARQHENPRSSAPRPAPSYPAIQEPYPAPPAMTPIDAFLAPLPISAPPESLPMPPVGTAPGVVMSHYRVLPFQGSVRALPRIADELPPRPPRREGDIDATTDVIPALLDSEIMPFESAEQKPPANDDLDGTMMLGAISFDDDDPLPFSGSSSAPPLSDATILPGSVPLSLVGGEAGSLDVTGGFVLSLSDSSPLPFETGLDTSASFIITLSDDDVIALDTTGESRALDVEDALPFAPPPPPETRASLPVAAAAPSSRPRDPLEQTTVVRALDFDLVVPDEEDELDSTTLFKAVDLGLDDEDEPASAAPPAFTLDQLASLHAELSMAPYDAAAIRARYQLFDHATQERWEAYWLARFEAQPEERAAYHHKLAQFRAWLASRSR